MGAFFMNTIFAKKLEMGAKYTSKGERVGVTVLRALPTTVVDLRTKDKHGHDALRAKIKTHGSKFKIREIRTEDKLEPGTEIKIEEVIKVGDRVSVAGITKG